VVDSWWKGCTLIGPCREIFSFGIAQAFQPAIYKTKAMRALHRMALTGTVGPQRSMPSPVKTMRHLYYRSELAGKDSTRPARTACGCGRAGHGRPSWPGSAVTLATPIGHRLSTIAMISFVTRCPRCSNVAPRSGTIVGRLLPGTHRSPTPACVAAIGNAVRLFPLPGRKS
jgi:hypothetical protein